MFPQTNSQMIDPVFPGLDPVLFSLLQNRLDRFAESFEKSGLNMKEDRVRDLIPYLVRVMLFSEFAAEQMIREPGLFHELAVSNDLGKTYSDKTHAARLEKKLAPCDPGGIREVMVRFKLYETLRIAWRDLNDLAGLDETMADLSTLATACISQGLDSLYRQLCQTFGTPRDGQGRSQQLMVLGMGKLGAGELNFSSDIDLIFVYPEEGFVKDESGRDGISNDEFFTRLGRKFVNLFAAKSGVNFFRVDTRLRPFGDSGPIVMSASVFEEYYQAHGREWERYAMIKARPVAGDLDEGYRLLKNLNAFIYRRYFDYGSFDSFRDMKHRISLQVKSARLKNNIKLGAGGIREIEFFAQLFQLIRGGVEPGLQERKVLKVLDLLLSLKCIQAGTRDELKGSYIFLRRVENRLQEYQDRQTHDIPEHPDQRLILALSMGFKDFNGFNRELTRVMNRVHHHFSQLLVTGEEEKEDVESRDLKDVWLNVNDPQFTADAVEIAGYKDPERILAHLRSLAVHPNTRRLTENGRKKLARLVPMLVKKAGRENEAGSILGRLIDLVITVERRTCYLSLLLENKGALETLIALASKSPWIVNFLSNHPVLLDELMHPATLYSPPKKKALEDEIEARMAKLPSDDLEYRLEELNIFRQVNTLRVAAADVSGGYPLMKVSDHLTYIAETILARVLRMAWEVVASKYGLPPDIDGADPDQCGFAILAYGKAGGLEMGYKSDLDLVFLYRGESGMTRGGKRSIEDVLFYSNLGQRIIHILTMHTPAGTLYGADMRLRPGGSSGTIVSHINAFEEYLNTEAWTWEHQALIRARPITGDSSLIREFEKIRESVLCIPRPEQDLRREVGQMRERMRKERLKPAPGMFDLKQDRGGIVDIEFLVQYLILRHAHVHPDITVWTDNIRLLESLSLEGIITGEESQILQEAYVTMRKRIHRMILQEEKPIIPDGDFSGLAAAVRQIYQKYLGPDPD
ncbi:bifunctional [glutamate--ammonia ligase]-adenylyl-L-tyrosine phosphorylase/[glutamate--ammonia-ligase] adenylyltransferase [Desulfospira joergensenii]|uniref:bifunctional [glutamate--ammonia ligase]-adenylyl-L-tyrosine phosphorylase/[glutamate--ammonia-ligase] adenylyltransferase n=1 Tax=Desulfospira joergensenii TaxID=53329 RepID=UPI0003B3438C|nr:bifunctional [glutamate--ammonia ligase]-adenylyl-L-tyrosine phosphorylase/[glutamate--ammonia-ligase] adenylyltransferase [Desulfospira joergensenii]